VSQGPLGEEREVKFLGGTAIDGAPVAYIVVLAAVVVGLAFVPLSAVIGSGKSFPMSQAIYPLIGWILGPIAGATADAVGALIGILLAPHTTTVPAATLLGALLGGFAAGAMAIGSSRKNWWIVAGWASSP
jgi:predicted membrane protein